MRVEQSDALNRQILHMEEIKETKWGTKASFSQTESIQWPLMLQNTNVNFSTLHAEIHSSSPAWRWTTEKSRVYLTDQKLLQNRTILSCTYCTAALRVSTSVTWNHHKNTLEEEEAGKVRVKTLHFILLFVFINLYTENIKMCCYIAIILIWNKQCIHMTFLQVLPSWQNVNFEHKIWNRN